MSDMFKGWRSYLGEGVAEQVVELGGDFCDAEAVFEVRDEVADLGDQRAALDVWAWSVLLNQE